jgi:hypothetical protein
MCWFEKRAFTGQKSGGAENIGSRLDSVLVSCPATSFQFPDLASMRVSVIERNEATKQSPALALQPREIASLRSQLTKMAPSLPSRNAREGFRWLVMEVILETRQ